MKRKLLWGLGIVLATAAIAAILNPILLMIPLALTGLYTGTRSDTPFVDAHERAVRSFVKSEGFGMSRLRRKELWNEWSVRFEGATCKPGEIRLIGLTKEKGYRYFEEKRPPKKKEIATSDHRELNKAELAAVEAILFGDVPYVKIPSEGQNSEPKTIRVIAPIRALESCLECHKGKVGTVLGAFDYHLTPESRTENTP